MNRVKVGETSCANCNPTFFAMVWEIIKTAQAEARLASLPDERRQLFEQAIQIVAFNGTCKEYCYGLQGNQGEIHEIRPFSSWAPRRRMGQWPDGSPLVYLTYDRKTKNYDRLICRRTGEFQLTIEEVIVGKAEHDQNVKKMREASAEFGFDPDAPVFNFDEDPASQDGYKRFAATAILLKARGPNNEKRFRKV